MDFRASMHIIKKKKQNLPLNIPSNNKLQNIDDINFQDSLSNMNDKTEDKN